MNFRLEYMNKAWLMGQAKEAHRAVIGPDYVEDAPNADFALVVFYGKVPFCYCTVRLLGEMAFMPYGGIWPEFRGQKLAQSGFDLMVDELLKAHRIVGFESRQSNRAMQMLGLKKGFVFSGMGYQDKELRVHMVLEGAKDAKHGDS